MNLKLVTPPTLEPILIDDGKRWAKIDGAEEDEDVDSLIKAAREYAETFTNRALITQTWDLFLDQFPPDDEVINVPRPRLQSVTSLKYTDTDGVQQTWAASNYIGDTNKEPGRIALAFDKSWPDTRDIINAVEIRFVAGYGTDRTDVPEEIRSAMKMLVEHWYDNRGPVVLGTISTKIQFNVDALLRHHKTYPLF